MTKISAISKLAIKTAGKSGHILKKYTPEILTTIGIAGGVTAAVFAARATLKLEETVDETKAQLEEVRIKYQNDDAEETSELSHEERIKDLAVVYIRGTGKIAKLYAPATTIGIVSIVSILAGQGILRHRNVALIAAYATLEEGFSAYRDRVVLDQGKEKDLSYLFDDFKKEVVVTKDDGSETTELSIDERRPGYSIYARFFDETLPSWEKNHDYNLQFLINQQNYVNDLLNIRGHVFLHEVYDRLGIDRTPESAVVGWLLNGDGDGYIDFGIYDSTKEGARRFVNASENAIFLDFNVDGVIYDKI